MASLNTPTNEAHLGGVTWVKITVPLTAITAGFVALRIWWRHKQIHNITPSDIAVVLAMVFAIVQEVVGCIGILNYGFGHHSAYLGPEKTRKALMYFYIYQIPYKILVSLTKMSLLFLYLEIFIIPWFQKLCHIVNASVVAALFAFTLTTIFQCRPIKWNWDRREPGGYCIHAPPFWYGHAGWNTALDIFILLMPMPVIKSLRMPRQQKFALAGVFVLGAFVCVTSIMRMITLDIAAKGTATDLTYATGEAFIWTQVESDVGIICCCLPTLKAFATRFLPQLFGSKGWSSRNNAYSLSEVNNHGISHRAWRDNKSYPSRTNPDTHPNSSEEQIIQSIRKTVEVSVINEQPHGN